MPDPIEPFRISASDAELDDLRRRLRATRWPDRETVDDWSQGIPARLRAGRLRATGPTSTTGARARRGSTASRSSAPQIDGLGIHFVHVRSPHANALPLVITHGWPGSIVEFQKVIEPLTNPTAHGGEARDAFHVVCPSLPGYGFSRQADARGLEAWSASPTRGRS